MGKRCLAVGINGGGGDGTPSAPNNSFQYNNNGAFDGDDLATRDAVTKYSKILRENSIEESKAYIQVPYVYMFPNSFPNQSVSCVFAQGDEIEGTMNTWAGTVLGSEQIVGGQPSLDVTFTGTGSDEIDADVADYEGDTPKTLTITVLESGFSIFDGDTTDTFAENYDYNGLLIDMTDIGNYNNGDQWELVINPTTTYTVVFFTLTSGELGEFDVAYNVTNDCNGGVGVTFNSINGLEVGMNVLALNFEIVEAVAGLLVTGIDGDKFFYDVVFGEPLPGNFLIQDELGPLGFIFDIDTQPVSVDGPTGFETGEFEVDVLIGETESTFECNGSFIKDEKENIKSYVGVYKMPDQPIYRPAMLYSDGQMLSVASADGEGFGSDYIFGNRLAILASRDGQFEARGVNPDGQYRLTIRNNGFEYRIGNEIFNLPTVDGTVGQALVTDGNGNMSFASITAEVAAENGLSIVDGKVQLGGVLVEETTSITMNNDNPTFKIMRSFPSGTLGYKNISSGGDQYNELEMIAGGLATLTIGQQKNGNVLSSYNRIGELSSSNPNVGEFISLNFNTGAATRILNLKPSNSEDVVYNEFYQTNQINGVINKKLTVSNGTYNGEEYEKNIDPSNGANLKVFESYTDGTQLMKTEFIDTAGVYEHKTTVSDGTNYSDISTKTDEARMRTLSNTSGATASVKTDDNGVVTIYSNNGTTGIEVTFNGVTINAPVPEYADNAAAIAGGLAPGDWYRISGDPKIVI